MMAEKKTLLITGSVGGLFGEFVRRVIYEAGEQWRVVSVDKIVNESKLKSGIYTNKLHTFYLADITDQHIMNRIFQFEEPNVIVHGAEETSGPNVLKSNVSGTQILIDCALKYGAEKFIFRSTDKVYGSLDSENDDPKKEEGELRPENKTIDELFETKRSGELIVEEAHQNFGLPYVIVRGSNSYGPRQITPDKLIPKTIRSILKNEPIEIFGEGNEMRDWIHAHDYSAALMMLLGNVESGIFNVGSGQEFSALEVVQRVCNAMEKGHELIKHVEDPRERQSFRFAMNCEKMRELGWKPGFKFKDGIKNATNWYQLNQHQLFLGERN